ncbi:MAG: 50S ribosomal protein L11 methyltransferase [Candidatus Bathyarchaeota archaeon]|nr:MAG: 50S ribosomal protein L11 methyltransferase [Candidatus Bathyarchaeota archaeon]
MQKRLVRKLDLEKAISKVKPHPTPRAYLEQYTISTETTAKILHIAAYTYDDIIGKTIMDLGCGTGRLAIGAVLVGAKEAFGVDIDREAIRMAHNNAEKLGVKERTHWIIADIDVMRGSFDTVLQNPPFGVQRKGADRKFLEKSLKLGYRVYSLHKSGKSNREFAEGSRERGARFVPVSPSPFLKRFIEKHGGEIKAVYAMRMTIPHMFDFHKKRKHEFMVGLYVIEGKKV